MRKRTEKSFLIPVDEIRNNSYDLSINQYKETEYDEIQYEEPKVILASIKQLEDEIMEGLEELGALLGGGLGESEIYLRFLKGKYEETQGTDANETRSN